MLLQKFLFFCCLFAITIMGGIHSQCYNMPGGIAKAGSTPIPFSCREVDSTDTDTVNLSQAF